MKTYFLTNPNQHGKDLIPLQHALKKIGLYHGPEDGIFGLGTADACKRAKNRLGYPSKYVLPTGGQTLLDYLQGKLALPPMYKARRRARRPASLNTRQKIVKWAEWAAAHEPEIHYAQVRPIDGHRHPGKLPLRTDCSGMITNYYEWSGGPDPNGFGFNGLGYTGTLLDHGATISVAQAEPGDVVIWGRAPGHHTAIIVNVSDRSNPMLVSHGSEAGPRHVTLRDETRAQERFGAGFYTVKRYL